MPLTQHQRVDIFQQHRLAAGSVLQVDRVVVATVQPRVRRDRNGEFVQLASQLIAHVQRQVFPAMGAVDRQLHLMPGAGQAFGDTGADPVAAPVDHHHRTTDLYFIAQDRGRAHLYRYAIASRTASVAVQGGWMQALDVAADVIVASADSLMHPARVHALREGQAPLRLETFNDALLATLRLGDCEEVSFKGALGEPVQMWLTYPPRFDRKKKHPVLHSIHGGPHAAAGDTFHYRWNTHAFAAQGYVVACVNYHGSSGFGQAFLDSITHHWGELELQDVEAGSGRLLKHPWADRKRLCAAGGSHGAFRSAWVTRPVQRGRDAGSTSAVRNDDLPASDGPVTAGSVWSSRRPVISAGSRERPKYMLASSMPKLTSPGNGQRSLARPWRRAWRSAASMSAIDGCRSRGFLDSERAITGHNVAGTSVSAGGSGLGPWQIAS